MPIEYDPRLRRTKIVATLGPATSERDTLAELLEAGVNVIRINSSHGSAESRADSMLMVREVADELGRHVALLVDLQGPRIRVGKLNGPVELEEGEEVVFAPEDEARSDEIPITYPELARDLSQGSTVLLDDGILAVEVTGIDGRRARARVRYGGVLKSNKGINVPGVELSTEAVTEKDQQDIELAVRHGADYVGISFVQRVSDIEAVRSQVPETTLLISKIEKAAALRDLKRIVRATDAVMVARGDLGVELLFEEVPLAQKRVINLCNRMGRPVVTATQMLESMIRNPRPTRAEASDVANAILDGTDAVMLSAETAVGDYPVASVEAMARIIGEIERSRPDLNPPRRRRQDYALGAKPEVEDAIAVAACAAAEMLRVPVVVSFTKSGFTARKISALRPDIPILGLSTEEITCRQLALVWGVVPCLAREVRDYDQMVELARSTLLEDGYAREGDRLIVTAGVPFEVPGTTNLIRVEAV